MCCYRRTKYATVYYYRVEQDSKEDIVNTIAEIIRQGLTQHSLQWVNVEDHLPPKTTWLLVQWDGAVNCMAYDANKKAFEDWTYPQNPNIPDTSLITHWAYIPK